MCVGIITINGEGFIHLNLAVNAKGIFVLYFVTSLTVEWIRGQTPRHKIIGILAALLACVQRRKLWKVFCHYDKFDRWSARLDRSKRINSISRVAYIFHLSSSYCAILQEKHILKFAFVNEYVTCQSVSRRISLFFSPIPSAEGIMHPVMGFSV